MLARRFLWVVAGLTVLVVAAALVYRLFGAELIRFAMVPSAAFEGGAPPAPKAYADKRLWIARPDLPASPGLWMPAGMKREGEPVASVFFIHPTSYLQSSHWNAPLADAESQWRAKLFVQSQASVFNGVADIWAPKYRQATFGAFLTTKSEAQKALDFAYRDVSAAFDQFLEEVPKDRPIILAAHSQGSLHLMRLLAGRIAGKPEAKRIVAAYVIGWPVSIPADLPALGLPACRSREEAGCVVSWQSFAEPADPKQVTDVYDKSAGPTGLSRAGSPMLCTNPLTGAPGGEAPASANLGTLVPNETLTQGTLKAPGVPARCDVRGFLLIGEDAPELGPYVLPGNNYHVYDYALFWANLRADAAARVKAFGGSEVITASAAEFRDSLPDGGRLLGLDVGTKTIGLALCDSDWTIATPAELVERGKFGKDLERLRALAGAQRVTGLVVGLPLNLDGRDSPRTQSVRAFARNLEPLGLPILLWDERWSTQAVTRTLLAADASRARRAELVDKMAAAYILQGAIDALTMG